MTEDLQATTGPARRRRRISDEETERRMLDAALTAVNSSGLTVSLEHLSLEDVIRDAGVSRSAVYRRWPYKDLFFSDLLRELAAAAGAGGLPDDTAAAELLRSTAIRHLDWLDTAEGRHELLVEILRQVGLGNFQFFHGSTQWRTYLALHATFLSLPSGDLRRDVETAIAQSERRVVAQIADSYEQWAALLGYRLRPELDATFVTMATLLNATMRGMVLMAPSIPAIANHRMNAAPFGVAAKAEWSQPALGIATITVNMLEPDPTIEWNNERLAKTRETLASRHELGG